MPNAEMVTLLQHLMAITGAHTGTAIKNAIDDLISTNEIDVNALQAKIEVIQNILDADPSTPEFDQAQNIIESLNSILSRLATAETTIARLEGDESVSGSVDFKVAAERTRAEAAEAAISQTISDNASATEASIANLQEQVDSLSGGGTGSIQSVRDELNAVKSGSGLEADGSYAPDASAAYISSATSLKDADIKLDTEIRGLEGSKADRTEVVLSSGIASIDYSALGAVFLDALNCGLSGGTDCDTPSTTPEGGDGDGAVL